MSNFVEFENRAPWSPGAKKTLSAYRGVAGTSSRSRNEVFPSEGKLAGDSCLPPTPFAMPLHILL
jgi:hypothetical protein